MRLRLEQQLLLFGGHTDSVFPSVELWLQVDTDRWHVLRAVNCMRSLRKYRSVVDYIFANVIVERRQDVLRFYRDKGPMLKDMTTGQERTGYEVRMLVSLQVLYDLRQQKLGETSWKAVRAVVGELAA